MIKHWLRWLRVRLCTHEYHAWECYAKNSLLWLDCVKCKEPMLVGNAPPKPKINA